MTPDSQTLRIFLDDLVRDSTLFPQYDSKGVLLKTFCNLGVQRNAPGETFAGFDKLMAEEICHRLEKMVEEGKAKLLTGLLAAEKAMEGLRVIAAMTKEEMGADHAHVARVYPASCQMSGSLGKMVPMLANIGKGDSSKDLYGLPGGMQTKPNCICKSSYAFPVHAGEARYYLVLG